MDLSTKGKGRAESEVDLEMERCSREKERQSKRWERKRERKSRAHLESMFVLNGSVGDEVEDLDAVESMVQSLVIIVVCMSDIYSKLLVASEPLWRSSDEDDVGWTSADGFEEVLKSSGSETSRGWEDGEFGIGRRHERSWEGLKSRNELKGGEGRRRMWFVRKREARPSPPL